MDKSNIKLYEGQDKYIFVSYCHKDWEKVYPVLEMLSDQGYRLWYDQGIHPGNQWPEIVAGRLNDGAVFLAFLSENYMKSQNCVREIHFAVAKEKDLLSVFLEPVELSLGIEMQLSVSQAVKKYAYPSDDAFYKQILLADVLASCKEAEPEVVEAAESVSEDIVKSEKKTVSKQEKSAKESKSKPGVLIGIAAIVLIVAAFVIFGMSKQPSSDNNGSDSSNIILEENLESLALDDLESYYEPDELDGKLVKDEKGNHLLIDSNQTRGVLVTSPEGYQESENAHSNYLIFRDAEYKTTMHYTLDVMSEHYTAEVHASRKDERGNYLGSESYGTVKASDEIQTAEINGMEVEYISVSYSKSDTRWDIHVQAWTQIDDFIVNCEMEAICDSEEAVEPLIQDILRMAFEHIKVQ